MADEAPVTAPDQHRPTNLRRLRRAAVLTALLILAMTFGNHEGGVENVWLVATAGVLLGMVGVDWALRRSGYRS